jgi:hypothetical protein
VHLTVQFVSGEAQVFPTQVYTYIPGSPYYVVAPQLPGYTVDIEIVQGTIYEDTLVIIHYTPIYNTVVIHYIYPDGSQAAPDYTALLRYGQEYDVHSPDVPGYRPVILIVSGRCQGSNIEHTVVYLPEDWGPGDLPVPLGLETTQMQIGICFE